MRIGIVNIGDELLAGKVLNTNAFDIARALAPLGHDIRTCRVLPDHPAAIARGLAELLGPAEAGQVTGPLPEPLDLLLVTGGLGPTRDDVTREGVAEFLGCALAEFPEAKGWLAAYLGRAPEELTEGMLVQVRLPVAATPLRNPVGTACGFACVRGDCRILVFPGVPAELRAMLTAHVLPLLGEAALVEFKAWTWGWSESQQRQALAAVELPGYARFSSLPTEKGVILSLSAPAAPADRARIGAELGGAWERILAAIPPVHLVDRGGLPLEAAVQSALRRLGATVATAESCTGGGLAYLLTEVPGSSAVFGRGFVTYANAAKVDALGVSEATLRHHGAISREVALEMAEGACRRAGADYGCALTGVAGPDGGSPEKPVGTVWVAAGRPGAMEARLLRLKGDRHAIRLRACYETLNLLRLSLQADPG